MTNEPDARDLFNPFMLWTDLGMRAAEVAVASTQNMTEGADRLTRAAASAEAAEADDDASSDGDNTNTWASASLGGMADMQRVMWDLTTRSWMRFNAATISRKASRSGASGAAAGRTTEFSPARRCGFRERRPTQGGVAQVGRASGS